MLIPLFCRLFLFKSTRISLVWHFAGAQNVMWTQIKSAHDMETNEIVYSVAWTEWRIHNRIQTLLSSPHRISVGQTAKKVCDIRFEYLRVFDLQCEIPFRLLWCHLSEEFRRDGKNDRIARLWTRRMERSTVINPLPKVVLTFALMQSAHIMITTKKIDWFSFSTVQKVSFTRANRPTQMVKHFKITHTVQLIWKCINIKTK